MSDDKDTKKSKTGGLLGMLGMGAAKKAGKELAEREAKIDKAVMESVDPVKPDPNKGKDAGELGKKWNDTFHF